MASFLLVMAYPRGLRWALRNEQMAWRAQTATATKGLTGGDSLFLYGASRVIPEPWWQGSIIGEAEALGGVRRLSAPVKLSGLTLTHGCGIRLMSLRYPKDAIPLRPLVPLIAAFGYARNPRSWQGHLQRPLVELTDDMAALLRARLLHAHPIEDARAAYEAVLAE